MRNKCLFRLITSALISLPLVSIGNVPQDIPPKNKVFVDVSRVSSTDLNLAIQRSKTYIVNACLPTGEFIYEVDDESGHILPKYNVIRHSGTIYSLGIYYETYPDLKVLDTMLRAAQFLKSTYIGQAQSQNGQNKVLAVWSQPIGSVETPSASLGGVGLGLVALAEVAKIRNQSSSIDDLESLGRLVLILERDDGDFYGKFDNKEGPTGENDSLYYPGEATLGLISLYEASRSRQWLVAAGKALSYLAKSREGQTQVPPDQWALIATAKLFPYYAESNCTVSQSELVQHAVQICNCIMNEQIHHDPNPDLNGGFDPSGRTTPTAVRVEGLLAALEFIPENQKELRIKVELAVRRGIQFLLHAQIVKGQYLGGMPCTIQVDPVHQFRTSEIRIDYVQHALSAFLRYQSFLKGHKGIQVNESTMSHSNDTTSSG